MIPSLIIITILAGRCVYIYYICIHNIESPNCILILCIYIYIGACSSVMKKNNFLVSCQVIFTRGLSFLLIHRKFAGNLILLSLLKPRVPWDQRDAIHIMAVWPMVIWFMDVYGSSHHIPATVIPCG